MNISKSGYCHQYKIVHSDGSLEWISIDFKEARSGCSPDNLAREGFFGRMKCFTGENGIISV